ncbi:multiple epidermal growth factor-like domains protein 11 [Sphaeramia orbicularis]|uniref:multiple epidermal growth factor-like domains protein 11 n=1 Tax=Sphaeramia orbicularis TaxID=375764 RepID=UPI0011805F4C|nr:multiple epidermal growth factor-like domains protein 11 [Sphaeramia orbicularis]
MKKEERWMKRLPIIPSAYRSQCPPGHACPFGSAEPYICSPGTYQSSFAQSTCNTCPPGFYCMEGSSVPSPCPVGTVSSSAGRTSQTDCSLCPPGFFCNSSALTEPSGPCSPGHFCSRGSTEPSPVSQPYGDVCPIGHFCPQGSESPTPCPSGGFLPEPGASSSSHCRPCHPGKYCHSPGASQPTGLCFAGFFCTGGADNPTPRANTSSFICLREILDFYTAKTDDTIWMHNASCFDNSSNSGFYCPLGSAYPHPCEAGSYCNRTGLDAPAGPCSPGYHCPRGSIDPHATPCPRGHYCPLGTPVPLPCPIGNMKSSYGGFTEGACQPCPPGHYCSQSGMAEPSGQCAEGYYCPEGQSFQSPQQHVCSAGHYCKKGSAMESACLPGSYQQRQGQGSCETCPPGFYCQDQGMIVPLPCERGFYCPGGSVNQHACPAGTYGNMSGLIEKRQCSLCDPGMYCKGEGRTSPIGPCAAGFVCVGGASELSPSDNLTGYPCPPGFFCPVGTAVPKPCPKGTYSEQTGLVDESQCCSCSPGFYCSETGLSTVSGPCLPGFYCLEGSQTATPVSSASGGVCPAGHYCVEGSSVPSPCPSGSYQNDTGGKSIEDCKPCPIGQFQAASGQNQCNLCPPGFHCQDLNSSPSEGGSSGLSSPVPCPPGYICPSDSTDSQPLPCPKGTYSPNPGLTTTGECLVCPAGQFCGSEGLVEPSGPCDSGYLCLMGAMVPNPTDNRTGSLCPPGIFCMDGLRADGKMYLTMFKAIAGQDIFVTGDLAKQMQLFAQLDSSALLEHQTPYRVLQEHLALEEEIHNKTTAPPVQLDTTVKVGEGTVQPTLCPVGYYCPAGLKVGLEFPCPPGTLQNQLGSSSPDACVPCPAGMFCSYPGLSEPTGLCEAGYFCPAGSTSSNEVIRTSVQTLNDKGITLKVNYALQAITAHQGLATHSPALRARSPSPQD